MSRLKKPIPFETTFHVYAAVEIIGEGGTGKVYRAEDGSGGSVAIKLLDASKASAERRRRFKNELVFGTRNRHPNIVTVTDHGITSVGGETAPFYVMPVYDGSLREAIKRGFKPADVLKHFDQILDGVEAAHLQRVTHRDLKPENILWDGRAAQWVIADFGIAEFAQEELYTLVETRPESRLANFMYAAPEQKARGTPTGIPTDVFALGLILNEMFTASVPHGTGFMTIAAIAPEYGFLDELVDAMLRNSPADRPQSVDAIKRVLIGRKNEFVERQQLSQLQQRVITTNESDDPVELDPIRLVGFDWNQGTLTLELSQAVPTDWIQAIQYGPYSRSSVYGLGPERFRFQGNQAIVPVSADDVQRVIDYFKSWLGPANQIYAAGVQKGRRDKEQRARQQLENEVKERELRLKILSQTRI